MSYLLDRKNSGVLTPSVLHNSFHHLQPTYPKWKMTLLFSQLMHRMGVVIAWKGQRETSLVMQVFSVLTRELTTIFQNLSNRTLKICAFYCKFYLKAKGFGNQRGNGVCHMSALLGFVYWDLSIYYIYIIHSGGPHFFLWQMTKRTWGEFITLRRVI